MENIKVPENKKCSCKWCNKSLVLKNVKKIINDNILKELKIKNILYSS